MMGTPFTDGVVFKEDAIRFFVFLNEEGRELFETAFDIGCDRQLWCF